MFNSMRRIFREDLLSKILLLSLVIISSFNLKNNIWIERYVLILWLWIAEKNLIFPKWRGCVLQSGAFDSPRNVLVSCQTCFNVSLLCKFHNLQILQRHIQVLTCILLHCYPQNCCIHTILLLQFLNVFKNALSICQISDILIMWYFSEVET